MEARSLYSLLSGFFPMSGGCIHESLTQGAMQLQTVPALPSSILPAAGEHLGAFHLGPYCEDRGLPETSKNTSFGHVSAACAARQELPGPRCGQIDGCSQFCRWISGGLSQQILPPAAQENCSRPWSCVWLLPPPCSPRSIYSCLICALVFCLFVHETASQALLVLLVLPVQLDFNPSPPLQPHCLCLTPALLVSCWGHYLS